MGSTDKVIRLVTAVIITLLYFTHIITGTFAIVLMILAAIFLLTSIVSFCPLYTPFKINTYKRKAN